MCCVKTPVCIYGIYVLLMVTKSPLVSQMSQNRFSCAHHVKKIIKNKKKVAEMFSRPVFYRNLFSPCISIYLFIITHLSDKQAKIFLSSNVKIVTENIDS